MCIFLIIFVILLARKANLCNSLYLSHYNENFPISSFLGKECPAPDVYICKCDKSDFIPRSLPSIARIEHYRNMNIFCTTALTRGLLGSLLGIARLILNDSISRDVPREWPWRQSCGCGDTCTFLVYFLYFYLSILLAMKSNALYVIWFTTIWWYSSP